MLGCPWRGGCSAGAAWFTDLVPAPRRTNPSIRPRCQAGSPALPPLEFPSWTSEELTQHEDQLLLSATLRVLLPPLTAGKISRALSKPGTRSLYAWLWSLHLKWLPDASRNLPKPHSPADYPMSSCFCPFSKLPLFCLCPSLPAFMLCLCSALETRGLQLHLASPLLLPVLIETSLLRGKSI